MFLRLVIIRKQNTEKFYQKQTDETKFRSKATIEVGGNGLKWLGPVTR